MVTFLTLASPRRNASFSIFTGDVVCDEVWNTTSASVTSDMSTFFSQLPGVVYSAGGNHGTSPVRVPSLTSVS